MSASKQVKDETNLMQENLSGAIAEEPPKVAKKEENKQEKKSPETTEIKLGEGEVDEQVDMSGMWLIEILSKSNDRLSQVFDNVNVDVYFY